ncbi:MAG TPA: hypothetical protein VF079_07915 [Sphingomicrobium sp.]
MRDWVGLGFEILVVALGVLLAFQIDQWAQDRRQARDEQQFLDRMWTETGAALEETDWIMTLYGRFRQEAIDGYRALEDPARLGRLTGKPNIGCRGAVMPGLGYNTTSFQELSSSGRLNSISDPQIRSSLRAVVAAQADAEANRENSVGFAMEGFRMVEPHLVRGLDANDDRTCRVDWPALAKDPSGSVAMARAARLHSLMWMKYAFVHDRLTIAHNRLACRLGKSDCHSTVELILRGPPRTDTIASEARDDVRRSAQLYNGS